MLVRRTVHRLHDSHQWRLPSWGTSLLVHAIALLILALIYFSGTGNAPEPQFRGEFSPGEVLGEGLISTVPAEIAGDPFTTNQPNDRLSLIQLRPSRARYEADQSACVAAECQAEQELHAATAVRVSPPLRA